MSTHAEAWPIYRLQVRETVEERDKKEGEERKRRGAERKMKGEGRRRKEKRRMDTCCQ